MSTTQRNPHCPRCAGTTHKHGRRAGHIFDLTGDRRLSVTRYRCPACPLVFTQRPLAYHPGTCMTRDLAVRILQLRRAGRSCESIAAALGQTVSRSAIARLCQRELGRAA